MASIKRSSKGLDATDQPPKKVVKTSAPDASIDASVEKLNVANARVESLEKQLEDQSQELYQYFSISGTFRYAPRPIQRMFCTGPNGIAFIRNEILLNLQSVASDLQDTRDLYDCAPLPGDIEALLPFLTKIEKLRTLPNSTVTALDLLIKLEAHSYVALSIDGPWAATEKSVTTRFDNMLHELAIERRTLDPTWPFAPVLAELKLHATIMKTASAGTWLAKTMELASAWEEGRPEPTHAAGVRRDLLNRGKEVPTEPDWWDVFLEPGKPLRDSRLRGMPIVRPKAASRKNT